MKTSPNNHGNKFTSFFCNVFGHHYVVSKKVTQHIKEYKCIHCQKQVTTDVSGKLSALTPQMQDINSTLEDMYRKRRSRVVHQVA
jgi:transposase-like protein